MDTTRNIHSIILYIYTIYHIHYIWLQMFIVDLMMWCLSMLCYTHFQRALRQMTLCSTGYFMYRKLYITYVPTNITQDTNSRYICCRGHISLSIQNQKDFTTLSFWLYSVMHYYWVIHHGHKKPFQRWVHSRCNRCTETCVLSCWEYLGLIMLFIHDMHARCHHLWTRSRSEVTCFISGTKSGRIYVRCCLKVIIYYVAQWRYTLSKNVNDRFTVWNHWWSQFLLMGPPFTSLSTDEASVIKRLA